MKSNVTYLDTAQIAEEVDYNFGRAFHGLGKLCFILPMAALNLCNN
jgi:hypothetical protein